MMRITPIHSRIEMLANHPMRARMMPRMTMCLVLPVNGVLPRHTDDSHPRRLMEPCGADRSMRGWMELVQYRLERIERAIPTDINGVTFGCESATTTTAPTTCLLYTSPSPRD